VRFAVLALAIATALGVRTHASGVRSADARLQPGSHKTLLAVRGLGRWVARCERGVSVTFIADRLLPTSDLVVTRAGAPLARRVDPGEHVQAEPPAAVIAEHWQIAPFAAAQVQVATASVAGSVTGDQCAASVLVTTGPDQGATITG
jgi:hypothetical protein